MGGDPGADQRELSRRGVAGSHARWTESEIRRQVRDVAAGERSAMMGLEPFYGATVDDLVASMARVWGWSHRQVMASINPATTLEAFEIVVDRMVDTAESRGTVALATGRPASLLPVYAALARRARTGGANVVTEPDTSPFVSDGRAGRFLRWVDGVAVLTDGDALLPTRGIEAGDDWVFRAGRVDLWVCDHGFAGAALRAEGRIAAFVDFDTIAVAVATSRLPAGRAVAVPLNDQRPPLAYQVLIDLASNRIEH